jgi:hypothetical protein
MSHPQDQPPSYGGPPAIHGPNHPSAVPSLVLGILSLVMCGLFTGIPAMVTGRRARREIAASGGAYTGDGLATAGFVTGLIGTIISGGSALLVVLVFIFGGVFQSAFQQTCESVNAQHPHRASSC